MCIAAWAIRPEEEYPVVCVANRDEFHHRPTLPLQRWAGSHGLQIYAGLDEQSGGTWMGVNSRGLLALLTNVRNPSLNKPDSAPTRGKLVWDALNNEPVPASRYKEFSGFNLLTLNLHSLHGLVSSNQDDTPPQPVKAGIQVLSNGSLNSTWPKMLRLNQALDAALGHSGNASTIDHLFAVLEDTTLADDDALPSTGIPLEWERRLSSIKIVSPSYGTRSSTVVRFRRDGQLELQERSYAADGTVQSTARFELTLQTS
ncbi:MAG: NRDE family protein [Limnobacter sp.]|uniref:NRDE family protein n=1 Tax=Limnobacter sp. TaxID=2003368 RepID=UPI00391B254F